MSLGGPEILIIVVIAVLLFGANWLPKAARNLGKAKVEMDKTQKQFAETKKSVEDATGMKELQATMNKANKALNTSPKKLLSDAAKSAAVGGAAAKAATTDDDQIEDAEIVEPSAEATEAAGETKGTGDTNINLGFD